MTDEVQKIKEWLKTRKLFTMDEHMKFYCKEAESDYNLLCSIEKFLDSMQEEPVSEDLEEAAEDAMQTAIDTESPYTDGEGMSLYPPEYLKSLFIDGANWQKEQDKQWLAEEHKHIFAKGRDSMKQQMMNESVDGLVVCDELTHGYKDIAMHIPDNLVVGDIVKVIVIKEE